MAVFFAALGWLTAWAQPVPDLETLRTRAEQSDAEAQNALGNAYKEGQAGLKQNYAEALKWYRRAADQGFVLALYNLGVAYEQGLGVPTDDKRAFKYYLQAADQGYPAAQFNVGNMYANGRGAGQDFFEANLWFKQAADKGVVEAQFNLGLAYEAGRGVRKDELQAARWYKQAADRGFPRAQHNLALLFEDGHGVPKNEAAAAGYYRAAAEQGFGPAQKNYGIMLDEGRGGLARDPVQAWVWLSLAVENGASSDARDAVAKNLDAGQRAAATRMLAERHSPGPVAAAVPPPTDAPLNPAPKPGPPAASDRGAELAAALDKARAANAQLADANQRLELEKARLAQQLASGDDSGKLVEQLRAQSQRLADQVQALTADKEKAQRDVTVLTAQIKDVQQDLARTKTTATLPAADASRYEKQITELTAKLERSADSLSQLQATNQQLTDENARLHEEQEARTANPVSTAGGDQGVIISNLQRDNARLNDEVKRSTIELLFLNSQLRAAHGQAANPAAGPESTGDQQIAQQTAKAEQAARETARLQAENSRLTARVAELENQPKPVADNSVALKLTEAERNAARLQQQVAALQAEKADLEKWSRSLEQTVNEKSAQADAASSGLAELRQKFTLAQKQLADATTENRALTGRVAQAEQALASRTANQPDTDELASLRQQLAEAQKLLKKQTEDYQTLLDSAATEQRGQIQTQARVAELEQNLREARQSAPNPAEIADLKRQVAETNQALEKSSATVAELTVANDRLGKDLVAARQVSTATGSLRDELAKATEEAATLRTKSEQLARRNEEQATLVKSTQRNLDQALGRVKELEQVAQAASDTRPQDADVTTKLQTDLAGANATVEKLNATVAELTAVNDRLEKDLDNARKSTEAALAAQSQAVNAAQPEAYKMEIGTLQAQVKSLEKQIEEERGNSAKEISTLAAQLALTRETNKSLTEANSALLSVKQSEKPTVDKDEFDKSQAQVSDLTAERETLKTQLAEARKTATALPGLTDEKAALQERLAAVGAQLLKAQQDVDSLQKQNAEATTRITASQQAAEQAKADLAALQGKAAEAEKASDSQSVSVAELTQANTKLELEREDMRRLVESYRADITRLNQGVSAAQQQRADAERGAQQNVDAVTAQLGQLRRDLEAARTAQARLAEASAAQDRDRVAVITQLRTENGALAARLNQAQGTLDQIASAARLGTPAATIASGGLAPTRPVATAPVSAPEARFHTVAEGDSLSRISLRYYGTPNRWQEIFNANRDVLQGSSVLRVGMQLRIP